MERTMIYWYQDLYMDDKVAANPERCKRRVERRRPWKKNYVALTLASNEENLFEIMETRQLFFRRFSYMDLYVVGLTSSYDKAVELLQKILVEGYEADASFQPRKCFRKEDFSQQQKIRK